MSTANPYETPTTVQSTMSTSRTFTLKRIDVISAGLLMGVLYALLGLIAGAFFSLFAILGVAAGGGNGMAGLIGGIGAIIMMPIFYGIGGFLGGVIGALIYNVGASLVGGIKFDLE